MIISGFTPEGNRRMNLEYDRLKRINPSIIMIAVSGYGQTGPQRNRSVFDAIIQAESGARLEIIYTITIPMLLKQKTGGWLSALLEITSGNG